MGTVWEGACVEDVTEFLRIIVAAYGRWKYPKVSELLTNLNLDSMHPVFEESR